MRWWNTWKMWLQIFFSGKICHMIQNLKTNSELFFLGVTFQYLQYRKINIRFSSNKLFRFRFFWDAIFAAACDNNMNANPMFGMWRTSGQLMISGWYLLPDSAMLPIVLSNQELIFCRRKNSLEIHKLTMDGYRRIFAVFESVIFQLFSYKLLSLTMTAFPRISYTRLTSVTDIFTDSISSSFCSLYSTHADGWKEKWRYG